MMVTKRMPPKRPKHGSFHFTLAPANAGGAVVMAARVATTSRASNFHIPEGMKLLLSTHVICQGKTRAVVALADYALDFLEAKGKEATLEQHAESGIGVRMVFGTGKFRLHSCPMPGHDKAHRVRIPVPEALRTRLAKHLASGPTTSAIVGLAGWALETLLSGKKQLIVMPG